MIHAERRLGPILNLLQGRPRATPHGKSRVKAELMSLRIMVVDEEPKIAQLMSAVATPLGHIVLQLGDYVVAGQRVQTQRFDVAFVGMRLPKLDGLELARQIRNSQLNRNIIIVSTADDIASLRKAFSEGADLVLTKPPAGDHLRRMLAAMDVPGWRGRRHAARLPLFTEVKVSWNDQQYPLRSSLNISASGILLQPAVDVAIGQEVALEFKIAEVRASLNVRARIIRKEGTERVALEFIGLAPEDQNAIQVYVTGRLKDPTPVRDLLKPEPKRLFRPY
jgi:CheY-like chemotaxis protein